MLSTSSHPLSATALSTAIFSMAHTTSWSGGVDTPESDGSGGSTAAGSESAGCACRQPPVGSSGGGAALVVLPLLLLTALALACATDSDGGPSGDTSGDGASDFDGSGDLTGDADVPVDADSDPPGDAARDARPDPSDTDSPDLSPPPPSGCLAWPLDGEAPRTIVAASDVAALVAAVDAAEPGDVILLEDGVYAMGGAYLWLDTPGVSLRGQSGVRSAVVLDGEYTTGQVVSVLASRVTVADLTIRRAYNHGIHVQSGTSAEHVGTVIYNVDIVDPGQQAIKVNPSEQGPHPDGGLIACSHLALTDAGRSAIRDNCYTGGIDIHGSQGWQVRDNHIEGFWCEAGLSEHGIHFWQYNANALIERNLVVDCARGIGLGLSSAGEPSRTYPDFECPVGAFVDDWGGIIRNNVVYASDPELLASEFGFDGGVSLASACQARVVHNTVYSTAPPFASIEWRFEGTSALVANNLVSHNLRERTADVAEVSGNLENAEAADFVDAANADFHLAPGSGALGAGLLLESGLCDEDRDGDPRGNPPDVGADERLD